MQHDARLFRMYRAAAAEVAQEGGRVLRVVLDDELKGTLYRALNAPAVDGEEDQGRREALAAAHGVPLIDGAFHLPDVRLEIETAAGDREVRDLELVTEHYHRSHIQGKARAGFRLYRVGGGATRRGGTPFDPHLADGIVKL